ncbi:ATP-binding protein [Streptomyces sp. 4N509B]|uniref:ATP-binding protein n=1 Tax=Streptomyces sp. 4N509B TaxID=3457413 RepID=UPI003FCFE648
MQIATTLDVLLASGCAAAVLLLAAERRRHRRRLADARHRADVLRRRVERAQCRERELVEEVRHLAAERLPALLASASDPGARVPAPRHARLATTEAGAALTSVLAQAGAGLVAEGRRVDEAARAVLRGATNRLQAMCYQIQTTVDDMLHRYDDPELAEQLAGLDHLNEQMLRRLQVTGVVCGAGAGLVRRRTPLRALVMGASSRIADYDRVRIVDHLSEPVAVVDSAAEPVAVVVAELLANAVHHSPGTLPVEAGLHQAPGGAVVVISDAGIGMSAEEFAHAKTLLSGSERVTLAELGDPPRSGLAAVGWLCHRHGISVTLEPSPYAGVRAVVLVPTGLLTTLPPEETPPIPLPVYTPHAGARLGGGAGSLAGVCCGATACVFGTLAVDGRDGERGRERERGGERGADAGAEGGAGEGPPPLPRRRRSGGGGAVVRPAAPGREAARPKGVAAPLVPRDPEEVAARIGALQRGTARGRAHLDPPRADSAVAPGQPLQAPQPLQSSQPFQAPRPYQSQPHGPHPALDVDPPDEKGS